MICMHKISSPKKQPARADSPSALHEGPLAAARSAAAGDDELGLFIPGVPLLEARRGRAAALKDRRGQRRRRLPRRRRGGRVQKLAVRRQRRHERAPHAPPLRRRPAAALAARRRGRGRGRVGARMRTLRALRRRGGVVGGGHHPCVAAGGAGAAAEDQLQKVEAPLPCEDGASAGVVG
jgi:hypothetical protein